MWSFESSSRATLAGVVAALLAACGFHLRGQAQLPFETLYIPGGNPLVVELKRNVAVRSEEHTSELQSQSNLVCRLLLEKKKKNKYIILFLKKKKINYNK